MSVELQSVRASKTMLWIGRVLSALPVLLMLFGAVYGLSRSAEMQKDFSKYGFPEHDFNRIIIVELICVVLYVVPMTAILGAILLTGYLGGATATHVRVGEPFIMPVIVGVVLWLGLYFRSPVLRKMIPFNQFSV